MNEPAKSPRSATRNTDEPRATRPGAAASWPEGRVLPGSLPATEALVPGIPSEPEGRGAVWTEERGLRRGRTAHKSAPTGEREYSAPTGERETQ